jgi:hypothetical protein
VPIHDFCVEHITFVSDETHAPPIVIADAVLTCAIPSQWLQQIAGWRAVADDDSRAHARFCGVAQRHGFEYLRDPARCTASATRRSLGHRR